MGRMCRKPTKLKEKNKTKTIKQKQKKHNKRDVYFNNLY